MTVTTWTPRPVSALRIAASGATRVLPSPVRISAILPWWRTAPPMSWTSKWRMPSVRFIASRAIAKTSGRTSSRACLEALVLALAARLRQLAAALEVRVVELVLGRLVRARRPRGSRSRISAIRARICVVGERLELGFEGVGLVDQRLDASDLAVVRVDETGKELAWDGEVYGRGRRERPSERGRAC